MARYTIELPDKVADRLNEMAADNKISKAEVFRRALALLSVAERESKRDHRLGTFTEKDGKREVVTEIVGL